MAMTTAVIESLHLPDTVMNNYGCCLLKLGKSHQVVLLPLIPVSQAGNGNTQRV